MDSLTEKVDRDITTPFLLRLYCRTGAFHRPDEFASPLDYPRHVSVHTWPTATLTELTQQLAAVSPDLLPVPSIGTRVAYRLLYHDTIGPQQQAPNSSHHHPPRLATQDLGSVVIGSGGPGATAGAATDPDPDPDLDDPADGRRASDAAKTLADARFVVGDFVSVAILPPSSADGSVQPASAARTGRGYGAGQAVSPTGPPGMMRGYGGGVGEMRSVRMGRGGGGGAGGGYGREGGNTVPPVGEWRRGERLPDVPGPPGRGRDGGRRRW